MLRQPDVIAGLAGALATVPLLALGASVLHGRRRAAFATGAGFMLAAVLGAAVVAAARGGVAPWRNFQAIEAVANAVLALACACALLPPLTSRLGSSRAAHAVAAAAGGAIVLRAGLALAVQTGLAVRDDPLRISGVVLGVGLVCAATAVLVTSLRWAGAPARRLAGPWLLVAGGVAAVSTAVALACAEGVLFPIQLRASATSTFVTPGSTSETLLEALTGIAHAVPRAQVGVIAAAVGVGAALALWQGRNLGRLSAPAGSEAP